MDNALGVIEFSSIPLGYRIYNRILKDVHVKVYKDLIISPGKFIIMFEGSYAAVGHAVEWAINTSSGGILDYAHIGNINKKLLSFFDGCAGPEAVSDIGVIETETVCAGIELANRLLHGTEVDLVGINFDVEMNGRCLIAVSGTISSVKAAIDMAGYGELVSNVEESVFKSIIGKTGEING